MKPNVYLGMGIIFLLAFFLSVTDIIQDSQDALIFAVVSFLIFFLASTINLPFPVSLVIALVIMFILVSTGGLL